MQIEIRTSNIHFVIFDDGNDLKRLLLETDSALQTLSLHLLLNHQDKNHAARRI